jgi:phospholipid/cholesterol/gamma-HCH transport system substrate-binding protein
VRTAIRKHLGDFLAIVALFILALGIGGYILSQQRLTFPLVQSQPFVVKVELPNAQAVQPGQGQTVRVAGVEVGQVGQVQLQDGKAVVDLELEPKYKGLIRQDATALLRSKTGLKDMFVEVDPGQGAPLKENARIALQNTAPDINPDEFLSALDSDTRDYLKLLINGAGKGLKGRGNDLKNTFAALGPTHRDLARVTRAIANRRGNLRRLIHNYGLLVHELGGKDTELTRLVRQSNQVFEAFASQGTNISSFVSKLPGTLRQTESTLVKADRLAQQLRPTLAALRPPFRKIATANAQVLPLAREGTPELKNQIRPFVRNSQPFTRDFGKGARDLSKAGPDLSKSFLELNRLFNIASYNPGGQQGISEGCEKHGTCTAAERNRSEGYLFWLAWVAQNTTSIFSSRDATGAFRRATAGGVDCGVFASIAGGISGQLPDNLKTVLNGTLAGLPPDVQNTIKTVLPGPPGPPTVNSITDLGKLLGQFGLCSSTG